MLIFVTGRSLREEGERGQDGAVQGKGIGLPVKNIGQGKGVGCGGREQKGAVCYPLIIITFPITNLEHYIDLFFKGYD